MHKLQELLQKLNILEDGKPRPARNFLEVAIGMGDHKRRVDLTVINDDIKVSTVFVGITAGEENPRLFETMIFGGECDQCQAKWGTMAEAKEGHWKIVSALRQGKPPC